MVYVPGRKFKNKSGKKKWEPGDMGVEYMQGGLRGTAEESLVSAIPQPRQMLL